MKKILMLLVVLTIMNLSGCYKAEVTTSSTTYRTPRNQINVVCVEGHKFIILVDMNGANITQVWENGPDGPRPLICKEEK